jgi:hypothetical protein
VTPYQVLRAELADVLENAGNEQKACVAMVNETPASCGQ